MSMLYLFIDFENYNSGNLLTYNPYNEKYWDDIFKEEIHYYSRDEGIFYSLGEMSLTFHGRIRKDSSGGVDLNSIVTSIDIHKDGQQRDVSMSGFKVSLKELMHADSLYDLMSPKDGLGVQGGYGNQVLHGTANADAMQMGNGADTVHGLAGDDQINGYYGDDRLWGGSGSDYVSGDIGNDEINGGAGADTLFGGKGDDQFVYSRLSDSAAIIDRFDTIGDFHRGHDQIDLSRIDANMKKSGDQKFTFIEKSGSYFDGKAGELIWGLSSKHGQKDFAIELDVDGDKKADFYLQIHSNTVISSDDFIL